LRRSALGRHSLWRRYTLKRHTLRSTLR
jgi:hypothetical protein